MKALTSQPYLMLQHTRKSLPKSRKQSFFKAHKESILWALFMLVLFVLPGHKLPDIDFWELNMEDKLAHMAVFALLAGLLVWGEQRRQGTAYISLGTKAVIVILAMVFGLFTELVQDQLIPSRYGSIGDVLADAIGAILGTIVAPWVLKLTGFGYR